MPVLRSSCTTRELEVLKSLLALDSDFLLLVRYCDGASGNPKSTNAMQCKSKVVLVYYKYSSSSVRDLGFFQ